MKSWIVSRSLHNTALYIIPLFTQYLALYTVSLHNISSLYEGRNSAEDSILSRFRGIALAQSSKKEGIWRGRDTARRDMARKGYGKKGYGEEGIWRGRDMARRRQ